MRRKIASLLLLAAAALSVTGLAWADGRGRVNPAWLATLDLARSVRLAPQATPEELAELEQRLAPLATEQQRLLAEAVWLDAEEAWLVESARRLDEEKAGFERACSAITDESQLAECQAQADRINAAVNAHNARLLPFQAREARYTADVKAWLAGLDAIRSWMRGIVGRRTLSPEERALLEREQAELRAEIEGIQTALRRLASLPANAEAERADWEQRYREATDRSRARLEEYLADESLEAAQRLLAAGSGRLSKEIRAKIDKRINAAGAGDKELVKKLDQEIQALVSQRADLDAAGPALGRAVAALKSAAAALQPDAKDPQEALERLRDAVGDALGNPVVQRALRLSEAPATVFTFGKLIADASFDITTELLALRRVGQLDRQSDDYLAAVSRLDQQLKRKVARLEEIQRRLDAK